MVNERIVSKRYMSGVFSEELMKGVLRKVLKKGLLVNGKWKRFLAKC